MRRRLGLSCCVLRLSGQICRAGARIFRDGGLGGLDDGGPGGLGGGRRLLERIAGGRGGRGGRLRLVALRQHGGRLEICGSDARVPHQNPPGRGGRPPGGWSGLGRRRGDVWRVWSAVAAHATSKDAKSDGATSNSPAVRTEGCSSPVVPATDTGPMVGCLWG